MEIYTGDHACPPEELWGWLHGCFPHSAIQVMDALKEFAWSFVTTHLHLFPLLIVTGDPKLKPVIATAMGRRLPCVYLLAFVIFKGKTNRKSCLISRNQGGKTTAVFNAAGHWFSECWARQKKDSKRSKITF